ncbi:MAG: HD domain-containing protein [Spirochaetaceae bacterium]|nr:HD domain-containing protein [Spirochaetaceae bacterium]
MEQPPVTIPDDLKTAVRVFAEASRQCWLVGGAVRDGLLGRSSEDYDLATDAEPEEVMKLFRRTIPTGIKHGTVTVLLGTHQFETTTFRRDGKYTDGRRPDKVAYSGDILEDLARRDFTINAIAWDLINKRLLDPHNGREDLKNRIIRAIGRPAERFEEDGLRSIRACRFASQLGFSIDDETMKAIGGTLSNLPSISAERIWEELKKIFISPKPSTAFRLFLETGLLELLLPELDQCVGVGQKGRHVLDVFDHSLMACDLAPRENLPVRAAALFHDIGKPLVKIRDESGEIIFHRHDITGAEVTESILLRYKASNADRDRITRLVRHHMFHYTRDWSDAAVRRFMARVGLDMLDDLMILRLADASAIAPDLPDATAHLRNLIERIDGILDAQTALSIKDLKINGSDLMMVLGVRPGPILGTLLKHLLDCVLEDPEANEHDRLLDMGRRWLEIYG